MSEEFSPDSGMPESPSVPDSGGFETEGPGDSFSEEPEQTQIDPAAEVGDIEGGEGASADACEISEGQEETGGADTDFGEDLRDSDIGKGGEADSSAEVSEGSGETGEADTDSESDADPEGSEQTDRRCP